MKVKARINFSFKMRIIPILLSLTTLLFSCSDHSSQQLQHSFQEIKGRDHNQKRFDVYRARVPIHWIRKDPLPDESITDTKKALVEFIISDEDNIIRITVHNFPSNTIDERIPPTAQVARWQQQFEQFIPEETEIIPQAFSGYTGLKLRGIGILNHEDSMILGWSLLIGKEHYQKLSHAQNPTEENLYREMRSDVTIKAVGPAEFMQTNEEEINRFARSFELIEEIPSSS